MKLVSLNCFPRWLLCTLSLTGTLSLLAQEESSDAEDVFVLSPFTVEASDDVGYVASSSLMGGRLSTNLGDTASAISVLTEEFLSDVAATDFQEAARWAPNAVSDDEYEELNLFNDWRVSYRGLGAGVQSRNFFRWAGNSDSYSIQRIDFARGPNSIVFGDSGVGGIANLSTKRALPGRSFGRISLQVDDEGGYRGTIDYNQQVIKGKLAARAALLRQRRESWRDNGINDRDGVFLTVTYRPTRAFELRAEVEVLDQYRVIPFAPVDAFSRWDGVTLAPGPGTRPDPESGLAFRGTDALVISSIYGNNSPVNERGQSLTLGTLRQLLPTEMALSPGADVVLPNGDPALSFQAPNLGADQKHSSASLFAEWQLGKQFFFEVAGNVQQRELSLINMFLQSVSYDVNPTLPDGSPNDRVGEPFAEARVGRDFQEERVHELRSSAAYVLEENWGTLRMMAGISYRETEFDFKRWFTSRANGANPNIRNGTNRILIRQYLSERHRPVLLPTLGVDPVSGVDLQEFLVINAPNASELLSINAAVSGSFLNTKLNTIYGVRWDDFTRQSVAGNVTDPSTRAIIEEGSLVDSWEDQVTTHTFGAVYWLTDIFGISATYAESFTPGSSQVDILGRPLPPLESEGYELGLRFRLLGERVYGKISYYQNEQANDAVRLEQGFSGAINNLIDLVGAPGEQTVATNFRGLQDRKGDGWEFELTANIGENWRILANYAIPETEQGIAFPLVRSYLADRLPAWKTEVAGLEDGAAKINAEADIALIEDTLTNFVSGRRINGTHDYTANIWVNYTFADLVENLELGLGLRARGRRLVDNQPDDPFDYLYAPATETMALKLSYGPIKIRNMRLKFQLNVDNLLDDQKTLPFRYGTYTVDGTTAVVPDRYIYTAPRTFRITANLSF